jgi:hypothetical protein
MIVPHPLFQRLRAVVLATGVAALALAAAGCGGGAKAPSVASLGPTTGTTTTTSASGGGSGGGLRSQTNVGARAGFAIAVGGNVEELTRYAGCMRKNGVPSFPDPNAQGQITFSSASGVDLRSTQFQHAQEACQKLLPNGGQPSPAQQALERRSALAFSACMRSHGEPNFPDPQFGSGGRVGLRIRVGTGGLDPASPQFQTAQKACAGKNSPLGAAVGSKAPAPG